MVSVCCGLVTSDNAGAKIRLVHYTTYEYFKRNELRLFPEAQTTIAKHCINYLSLDEFGSKFGSENFLGSAHRLWSLTKKFPFYKYAALQWANHARIDAISDKPNTTIISFLRRPRNLNIAMRVMFKDLNDNRRAYTGLSGHLDKSPFFGSDYTSKGMNGLHVAAFCGLSDLVPLLGKEFGIDSADQFGATALEWALRGEHETTIESVLGQNPNMNAQQGQGSRAIMYAIKLGSITIVELLVRAHPNMNFRSPHEETTHLIEAIENGHQAIVKLLLSKGADPNLCHSNKRSALGEACANGHKGIAQLLIKSGAELDYRDWRGRTACMNACARGLQDIFQLLRQEGASTHLKDYDGDSAIVSASEYGHTAICSLLLETNNSLDPTDIGLALIEAARNGHETVVKLLLRHSSTTPRSSIYAGVALIEAAGDGHEVVVKVLLRHNTVASESSTNYGGQALIKAVDGGYDNIVDLLLNAGVDTEAPDGLGRTPIFVAIRQGNVSLIQRLIRAGADINAVEQFSGKTPIVVAQNNNYRHIVKLLQDNNTSFIS
ncbi:uncharacterized protein FRV6_16792 [Fusarium oxysporum]|uniref:Uncharacterized protein n=1 Tax=Fusarium oxysporum TaxID=5507 RepID=A0A2H3TVM0_FUSOX|nr:uncharacterized protein FRV6_16792 [Fusarium oxysporum]